MGAESSNQKSLTMSIVSGDTQSQQLFDYTSNNVQCSKTILKFPSFICLQGDQLVNTQKRTSVRLFQLSMPNFRQIKVSGSEKAQILWKVVEQSSQLITKGDFIKMGKVKLIVKDIVTSSFSKIRDRLHVSDASQLSRTLKSNSFDISSSKDEQCRVCFESHSTENDPLVSLCKCSGSVKFIHFKCLKDWTANNIIKREYQNYINYSYVKSHCQLCKQNIKNTFTHEGKNYTLFHLQKISEPHIILQTLEQQNNINKLQMFVIKLQEGVQVILGRNNSAEVILKDISISRIHCSIMLKNKQVFLKDKKSKFGTLIKVKNQLEFCAEKGLSLQYQSKLIKINRQPPLANCCCDTISTFSLIYQNQIDPKQNSFYNMSP